MKTWLVLDSPFLCYRAFHTTGSLSYAGDTTGVIYGFLQSVLTLQEEHATSDIIFCFDYGKSLREKRHPVYKQARRDKIASYSDEEKEARLGFRRQMRLLRDELLLEVGFRNILYQKGYEADDIIARVCEILPSDNIVIVSGDHDLYQLLTDRVVVWNPIKKQAYTRKQLLLDFGVNPVQWSSVKALAGCKSDGIAGIRGIGEKTASQYLAGKLKERSVCYQKIVSGQDIYNRNLPLVTLPYPGTKIPELQEDRVSSKKWRRVLERLGMHSLLRKV